MSGAGLPLGLSIQQGSVSPDHKPTSARLDSSSKARRTGSSGSVKHDSEEGEDVGGPSSRHYKPPLTEEQKKANHIQSEQKRREKIREQYDKLAELTPGMEGQGRSEGRVLEEAVKYAEGLVEERTELIQKIEAMGGVVDPALKNIKK